jgi:hypothetical protein
MTNIEGMEDIRITKISKAAVGRDMEGITFVLLVLIVLVGMLDLN